MVKFNIGSRAEVMHGTAKKTGGGLRKKDLKYNKRGKIVSKKASKTAKNNNNLIKAGYITKKGVFGVFKIGGSIKNNSNIGAKQYSTNNVRKLSSMGNPKWANNWLNNESGNNDKNTNNTNNLKLANKTNNLKLANKTPELSHIYNHNNSKMANNMNDILIRFKQLMINGKPPECIKYGLCNSIGYILQNFFETYTKVSTKIAKFKNNENLTLDNISLMLFTEFLYNISNLINLINLNNLNPFLEKLFHYKFDYSKFKIFTLKEKKYLINYNFDKNDIIKKRRDMYISIPDVDLSLDVNIETNIIYFNIGEKIETLSFNKTDIDINIEIDEDDPDHDILYLSLFFFNTTNADMKRYVKRYKEIIDIVKQEDENIQNTSILYSFELPGFILFLLKKIMKLYNYKYIYLEDHAYSPHKNAPATTRTRRSIGTFNQSMMLKFNVPMIYTYYGFYTKNFLNMVLGDVPEDINDRYIKCDNISNSIIKLFETIYTAEIKEISIRLQPQQPPQPPISRSYSNPTNFQLPAHLYTRTIRNGTKNNLKNHLLRAFHDIILLKNQIAYADQTNQTNLAELQSNFIDKILFLVRLFMKSILDLSDINLLPNETHKQIFNLLYKMGNTRVDIIKKSSPIKGIWKNNIKELKRLVNL